MNLFKLEIYYDDGVFLKSEIRLINLTTLDGEITILKNHSPLISILPISDLYYVDKNNKKVHLTTSGSILYVAKNTTYIIAESIYYKKNINKQIAEEIKQRLEKEIKQVKEEKLLVMLKKDLNRAVNMLKKVK